MALAVFLALISALVFFYYDICIRDSFGMIKDRFIMPLDLS